MSSSLQDSVGLGGQVSPLDSYNLKTSSASSTMTGQVLDANGRTLASVTLTVTSTKASLLALLLAGSPAYTVVPEAVGFRVTSNTVQVFYNNSATVAKDEDGNQVGTSGANISTTLDRTIPVFTLGQGIQTLGKAYESPNDLLNALLALIAGPLVVGHGKTIKTASGTLTADTDVIAAVSSKRIKVIAYSLITTGVNANAKIFKSNGTGGTELWRVILQAPAASSVYGANLATSAPSFLFATVAGEKLTLDVGDTDALHYSIAYFDDDAT